MNYIELLAKYDTLESENASLREEMAKAKQDAARLDFMSSREAWIAWSKDGESCRVFIQSENDGPEPIMGWGAFDAWYDTARKAIDAALAKSK